MVALEVEQLDEVREAIRFLQEGLRRSWSDAGIVMLDPDREGSTDTLISEAAIRSEIARLAI